MSNISALQSALSGLLAQRHRLDTIGHNIANVGTEGYSRQRVDLASGGNGPIPALFSDGLLTGDGVDVAGISRFRDEFLEVRSLDERSASSQLALQAKYFERIELVHTEPSDDGLAASLDAFWSAFDEVANYPGEIPQRAAALEQAKATAGQFSFMDEQIRTLHATAVGEAETIAARVNQLASEVASLNDAIRPLVLSNATPNDLLDQRDVALGELADLVGARVQNKDDGTVDVYVGGSSLVVSARTVELEAVTAVDPGLADVGVERLSFQWVGGGEVTPTGGEAAGILTMANVEIPDAIRDLDAIAENFVNGVNTIHTASQDLDLNTGWNFFEPTGTTAATIALSADVDGQPRRISAAAVGAGELDASAAQAIADLRGEDGGAADQYAELVGGLGVIVASVRARSSAQAGVLQRVDEARLAARSVNLDEEMIDMVAAQRAYEASARVINAVDEMLDVLVNRLGLVGR
ncbi:MAG: flagellar hook-associated protein FlgK [Actinomycetota bacterium]